MQSTYRVPLTGPGPDPAHRDAEETVLAIVGAVGALGIWQAAVVIVLISGPPAAGKSSLGVHLRDAFGIPYIDRDALKEHVYPLAMQPEQDRRRAMASLMVWAEVVRSIAVAGRSVIADPVAAHRADWDTIAALISAIPADTVEVQLTAPDAVLVERFRRRASPVLDGELVKKVDAAIRLHSDMGALVPSGNRLTFNTAEPGFDRDAVVAELRALGLRP